MKTRSELPVARPETGQPLPSLTSADTQRILDEEETGPDAEKGKPLSAFQRLQPFIGIIDSGGHQLSEKTGQRLRETLEERKKPSPSSEGSPSDSKDLGGGSWKR